MKHCFQKECGRPEGLHPNQEEKWLSSMPLIMIQWSRRAIITGLGNQKAWDDRIRRASPGSLSLLHGLHGLHVFGCPNNVSRYHDTADIANSHIAQHVVEAVNHGADKPHLVQGRAGVTENDRGDHREIVDRTSIQPQRIRLDMVSVC
jgi:hypothetical protein